MRTELWHEYVSEKQTLTELAEKHSHSHVWVRTQLDTIAQPTPNARPQSTVVIADTTFWGRSYGVCVFRSPALKQNIWWNEVEGERMAHYRFGRAILEERGWNITAAVVDGKRGFINVFSGIGLISLVVQTLSTSPVRSRVVAQS